ncbi:ribonuclease HII [Robertmurraya korlensis]|uniref:ribonuclease HII n=1 Tax=Robertmurraya korlensis TaxID=519977 RepID=UPI000824AAE5|nr:ribonuclease HII [Robertmurraya korlensis]
MDRLTIDDIQRKLEIVEDVKDPFFIDIQKDSRKGVQQLVKRWMKRKESLEQARLKLFELSEYERLYKSQGFTFIAGIDEVGRGPLAGPVVAGAVILPDDFQILGIDDSKKLTETKREELYELIRKAAVSIGIGIIEAKEIDKINIYEATKKAMYVAINELHISPDFLLVDAMKLTTPIPSEAIIKGDSKSISIAAASIIAKVTRDRMMKELAKSFPEYGFEKNMGYGTKEHTEALQLYGATPHHRRSFAPVKELNKQ